MLITFLLAALSILLASLGIAFHSRRRFRSSSWSSDYLFRYNNPALATASNIGSILSISVILAALMPAVTGWGYLPAVVFIPAIIAGFLLFRRAVASLNLEHASPAEAPTRTPTTLLDLVDESTRPILYYGQLTFFLSTIVLEIAFARLVLERLFLGSFLLAALSVGFVLALCATYTSVGGFFGVLRTDLFQLLIVLVACVQLLNSNIISIDSVVKRTFTTGSFFVPDLLFLLAFILTAVSFYFSMPELWLRNVGTLRDSAGNVTLKPLAFGGLGLLVVATPAVFIAFSILESTGNLNKSVHVDLLLESIARILDAVSSQSANPSALWWLLGAGTCVFVTTVDTWLISFVQHYHQGASQHTRSNSHRLPYEVAFACFVASLFADPKLAYFFGTLGTAVLFGNACVLLNLPSQERRLPSLRPFLITYYSAVAVVTAALAWLFWADLQAHLQHIILAQAFLALFLLMLVPRKLA